MLFLQLFQLPCPYKNPLWFFSALSLKPSENKCTGLNRNSLSQRGLRVTSALPVHRYVTLGKRHPSWSLAWSLQALGQPPSTPGWPLWEVITQSFCRCPIAAGQPPCGNIASPCADEFCTVLFAAISTYNGAQGEKLQLCCLNRHFGSICLSS